MKLRQMIMTAAAVLGLASAVALSTTATAQANTSTSSPNSVANVKIDGRFSDWQGRALIEGYGGYMTSASDGQYAYVYVRMKNNQMVPGNEYTFQINGKSEFARVSNMPGSLTTNAAATPITLVGGNYYGGTSYGTVGNGFAHRTKDYAEMEFAVDLTKMSYAPVKGQTLTVSNDANIGGVSSTIVARSAAGAPATDTNTNANSSSASSTSSASSSSQAVDQSGVITDKSDSAPKDTTTTNDAANNNNDNFHIVIDGNFADWQHIDLIKVAGDSVYNSRYMSMVSDGQYVYVRVVMQPYDAMPGYGDYNFKIGGQNYFVWTNNMPGDLTTDGAAKPVTFKGGKWNEGDQYGQVADGYVKRATLTKDGQSYGWYDTMEFRVDLSKFHLSSMTGQTITMNNPNVGNDSVTTSGGSTGPIVLSSIGVLIAGFGYLKLRKSGALSKKMPRLHIK